MLDIKPFQETLYEGMCGPASLKMIFDYYGLEKSEKEIAKMCGTTKELGTTGEGIQKAAQSLGLKAEIKDNSTFENIQIWLDRKVPVIVDWFTKGRIDCPEEEVPDGHYSVVVGLDDEYIYLQDPEIGKLRKIKRRDFMKVWFDFDGMHIDKNNLVIKRIIAIYKK